MVAASPDGGRIRLEGWLSDAALIASGILHTQARMPLPDVPVIVATRNRSALLARTLGGGRSQQDVCLEVVVLDDASTDDTCEWG